MRGLCDTMRTFRDSSRRFGKSIRKPIANSSHPSEIGALVTDFFYSHILVVNVCLHRRSGQVYYMQENHLDLFIRKTGKEATIYEPRC